MTLGHELAIDGRRGRGLQGRCSCGWEGPRRYGRRRRKDAERDLRRHQVALVRAARAAA